MPSRTADEIIEKARLAYSLDLISERTLEKVIYSAETVPGYTGILELPLDHEVKHEQDLRRKSERSRRRWRFWSR